jgi:hypothetical protein
MENEAQRFSFNSFYMRELTVPEIYIFSKWGIPISRCKQPFIGFFLKKR